MKTPRFSGPFKWSALRQQLLSLRDDVHTIRKVAGRNVTIDEHRGKGKVINARRDRAAVPPLIGCELPDGDCPHAVCFELFLDDTDASNQDFFDMYFVGAYFDGTDWQVYGDSSASLTAVSAFNTWHKFVFQFTKQGDGSVLGEWSVDGVAGPSFNALGAGATTGSITSVQFGAQGGAGAKHRSIRNITILGFAISFDFPPDSFSNLVGTGISESGGVLRIDNDSDDDAYGNKVTYADLICCTCPDSPSWRDCVEISAIDITYDFSGSSSVAGCTAYSVSGTHTFNFTRIDRTDDFDPTPGVYQFKMYQQRSSGQCVLIVEGKDGTLSGSTALSFGFAQQNGACSRIVDRFGFNASVGGDGCDSGTVTISGDETSVFVDYPTNGTGCEDYTETCGGMSCGYDGAFGIVASDLEWLPGDVSGLRGTYTSSNTCTGTDTSLTVGITVVIS